MAFGPAFDPATDPTRDGVVLTFILPTKQCNLKCPACVIRQRREAETQTLDLEDYLALIVSASKLMDVKHIAIQGYEPLLPEAWPYTQEILALGNSLGVGTSLVTNGIFLEQYAALLAELAPDKLTVSLDASTAQIHDLKRGVKGAFEVTVNSLRATVKYRSLQESLFVNSVLYPNRVGDLEDVPALLASIPVKRWSVSPLFKIGRGSIKGGAVLTRSELVFSLSILANAAAAEDVELHVDDEASYIKDQISSLENIAYRSINRVNNLIRIGPNGNCSIGFQILQTVDEETPKWNPIKEAPDDFYRRAVLPTITKIPDVA